MFTTVDIKRYYHFWGADVVTTFLCRTYDFYTYFYSVYVKFIGHNIQVLPHGSILYLLSYYVFGTQFTLYS
jgi:hypothetical protein